jgi:hypothetical protein
MISDRRIEIYRAGALGARRYRCSDLRGIDVDVLAEKVEHVLYGHGSRKGGREARVEVRPHSDGGNYLCGFISYESAARRFVGGYEAKTMFCHVPGWRDKKRLEIGRHFVCALIGQITADRN